MGRDCRYCGAYISGGLDVCPACGKKVRPEKPDGTDDFYSASAAQARQEKKNEENTGSAYTYKQEYERRYGENVRQESRVRSSAEKSFDGPDVSVKNYSYFAYFGILFLIPYIFKHDSEFVRYHCNQGLLLLLLSIVLRVASAVPFFGWLASVVGTIFIVVCVVKGLMNVYAGKKVPLPVIGGLNILK